MHIYVAKIKLPLANFNRGLLKTGSHSPIQDITNYAHVDMVGEENRVEEVI